MLCHAPRRATTPSRLEQSVNYSPNSLAKCQVCRSVIDEGEIRMMDVLHHGRHRQSPPKFQHLACFRPRALITNLYQLSGASQLQEQDKQKLIARLQACKSWSPQGRTSSKEEKRGVDRFELQLKSVAELKQTCIEKSLSSEGRKQNLVERLLDWTDEHQPWAPPRLPTPVVEWQLDKVLDLFDVLPHEAILKIISYLPPSNYANLVTLSRRFNEFLQDDLLWKHLFERAWPQDFKAAKEEQREEEEEREARETEKIEAPAKKQKLHHAHRLSKTESRLAKEERFAVEEWISRTGCLAYPHPYGWVSAGSKEKEPQTWKERCRVQRYHSLPDPRFQWPGIVIRLKNLRREEASVDLLAQALRDCDLATIKEICRLYGVDQSNSTTSPRFTLMARVIASYIAGRIDSFDKIIKLHKELKASKKPPSLAEYLSFDD